jgi:hypothetical protein
MLHGFIGATLENGAREEFTVLIFIEPRAFEIEQRNETAAKR